MKRTLLFAALAAAAIASVPAALAASFTYHGVLQDSGKPAQGKYDIELTLYASPNGGNVVGGPLTVYGVEVNQGSFATEADFGPLAKSFKNAYVGVKVRSAGEGQFVSLGTTPAELDTASSCPGSWTLEGNAGNPAGSYLGTADNQPLTFRVNGVVSGSITPGKGVAFGQGTSFFASTANGVDAFATGEGVGAGGTDSFAAGFGAFTPQSGSYMWGDSNSGGGITATTAANQYIVRAGGGVAVNGAPKNSEVEFSIYPSLLGSFNYSNIFLGNKNATGGILISAGDQSTSTSNDAKFYIDQFDGSAQLRRFSVGKTGIVVNDAAAIPANADTASIANLSVVAANGQSDALVDLYPHDPANPTLANYWSLLSDKSEFDLIGTYQFSTSDPVTHTTYLRARRNAFLPTLEFLVASTFDFGLITADGTSISGGGDITIKGNAYKPVAGGWLASSDRRVKNDIMPIADAVRTVMQLQPVSFHYTPEYRALQNNLPDKTYLGFIAQDFASVFPDAVESTTMRVPGAAASEAPILAIDTNPALITAVAAVQELAVRAQNEESRMRDLETENARLRRQLDTLAARLDALDHASGE